MSRTRTTKVHRVTDWAGWCTPCESEDRPLVLTRSGPSGLRPWLAGLGDDDRLLLLTCNVCGDWQVVPAREQDDPEVVLAEAEVPAEVDVMAEPDAPPVLVPAPRLGERIVTVPDSTPPAVSPEAVAAARRVLAAARLATQRTAPRSESRPAPLDRSRRTRNTATTRRADRPAAARVPVPAPRPSAAPGAATGATSIALPVLHPAQLVLSPLR